MLILLFSSFNAFADGWDASKPSHQTLYVDTLTSKTDSSSVNVADNFFVTEDLTTLGRVGIGTISPISALDIQLSANNIVNIRGPQGAGAWVQYQPKNPGAIDWQAGANDAGWQVYGNNAGVWNPRIVVSNSGNVGIGTSSPPQYKLEVSGSIKGNTLCIGTDCKSAWPIGGSGTGWDTSGNNLYSTVSGNIGVGTNNPTWKFVINSSSYTVLRVNSEGSGNSGYSNLYLTTNGETNNAQIWEYSTTATEWGGPSSLNIYNAKGPITFHPNALKNAMVLDNSGNLGIGTGSPAGHMLDIASTAGTVGNSAIRARYPGGGGLLGTEFAALAHRSGVWTALYSKQGASSSAAYFDGNVGISTAAPAAKLEIKAPEFWAGPNPAGLDNDRWFAALDGDGAKNDAGKIWMEYGPLAAPLIVLEDYDDPPRIEFRDTGTGAGTELSPEFSASIGLSRGLSNDFSIMGGNVGIGTVSPGAKLEVTGDFIRTIPRAAGLGPVDGTDVGQIASRVLTLTKKQTDTGIRVTYVDNLRTYNGANACRWEIRFDGASCTSPGSLVYDFYIGLAGENSHESRTLIGTCFGLAAGSHQVQIWVGMTPGYSTADCYTGWNNQYWTIEAEEVR